MTSLPTGSILESGGPLLPKIRVQLEEKVAKDRNMTPLQSAEKIKGVSPKALIPMGHRWYVYGHTTVNESGKKSPILPIRRKVPNWLSRSHIYTTMLAEDGSERLYGIPLDLDFEDADDCWKQRGKLDYRAVKAFIDETYPILGRYLCTYTRSTRGKGLGLILFLEPFLRSHDKTGGVTYLAERVQRLIVTVLNFMNRRHQGEFPRLSAYANHIV